MGALGIDVSEYQRYVDWQKAKDAGCQFAFIRACFGTYLDKYFEQNWAETKKLGIPRGAYGWVINGANQVKNAELFVSLLKDDLGELPLACDFEHYNAYVVQDGKQVTVTKYPTFAELKAFVETVEKLTGRTPFIYTSRGYWTSLANYRDQTWAAKYPLWHAQYTIALQPLIPSPFFNWTFWQFSSTGNGRAAEFGATGTKDLDINRFNGNEQDFAKLIGLLAPVDIPVAAKPDIAALKAKISADIDEWAKGS